MADSVDNLKKWFEELPHSEQINVVKFLYGGSALLQKGMYVGPRPGIVQRGLFCGPVPSGESNVCPGCGRPY